MVLQLYDLKESNEFLNSVIDNIHSAVFVVDRSLKIQEFNQALRMLFGKAEHAIVGELCGNAMGCAFAVNEQNPCGETSHCSHCELRGAIVRAFTQHVPTHRQKLVREFYVGGKPILKHFVFSTKHLLFMGREMILVIVDDMTESETQKLELVEQKRGLDEDLRAAAGIQQSLLPQRVPEVENLDLAWRFMPCEVIGGDIFNAFQLDEDHLGCYMVDVSGHGVRSALVSVSVSQTLKPSPPYFRIPRPAGVLSGLDNDYPFERFNSFFTMVYMILNFREGYLVYANAGHPPPILMHRDGRSELLAAGGTIIGLGGVTPYVQERRELRSGDRIILYTDGLVDQRNAQGELYGQERLLAQWQRCREKPIAEAMDGVLEAVLSFSGHTGIRDDVSLLGMDFKGKPSELRTLPEWSRLIREG